jgi:diguanylate cyclase (GGDEF)-like protein
VSWFSALAAAAVGGAAGAWVSARRAMRGSLGGGRTVLPSNAFRWLLEAHSAVGIWALPREGGQEEALPERVVANGTLSAGQEEVVLGRLRLAGAGTGPGAIVERLEAGTLVADTLGARVAGLLLPAGAPAERIDRVREDLRSLLEALAYRTVAEAWSAEREVVAESPGTVGLALAFEIERGLNAEVIVAAVEGAAVRVVGASLRSDRRLLNTVLPPESALARVARGELTQMRTTHDPAGNVIPDRRQRGTAFVVIPIRHGDRTIGAVSLAVPGDREPAASQVHTAETAVRLAAPRLGLAIETAAIRASATTDPLTGLLNRRGLQAAMNRVNVASGALIFADLDRFKLLNDTLGHPAGDAALVHFSAIIQEQVRGSDVSARVGGEEFAVWAPLAGLELGAQIAERIRAHLEESQWHWQGHRYRLSASFGVSAWPETSPTRQNLEMQADSALYVAKQQGRNRVAVAPKAPD